MAKFFKSIFNTSDKKKNTYEGDGEEDKDKGDSPPVTAKRQLSISRSGRMRQYNKKRHSLTLDVYGDINIDADKPKSVQYHVHAPANKTAPAALGGNEIRLDKDLQSHSRQKDDENNYEMNIEKKLSALAVEEGPKSPEDMVIDNAFDIIDKS